LSQHSDITAPSGRELLPYAVLAPGPVRKLLDTPTYMKLTMLYILYKRWWNIIFKGIQQYNSNVWIHQQTNKFVN